MYNSRKRKGDNMAALQISYEEYAKGVHDYISKLNALPEDEARERTIKSLISSGILNEDGSAKKTIVTGDFF